MFDGDGAMRLNEDEMLRDLAALVAIPSVTGTPACKDALQWLLARAREMGMETGVTPEGDAGWAEIGAGPVTLGVLVHVDVVGIGDRAKWLSDPFALCEREGELYGRGVDDNKGPAIMALHALRAARDAGVPARKRIRLVVGTSEESDWNDMRHYRAAFGSPDYGFSPDACFPVYNIEKGYADVTLRFPLEGVERLSAGDSPNTVPSRAAIAAQGGVERVYSGKSCHSSVPELGDNAITRLAAAEPGYACTRFINDFFAGAYHGERLGLDRLGDSHEGRFVGRTACAPTMLNRVGDHIELNVNIRYRLGLTGRDLDQAFAAHKEAYGYSYSLFVDAAPMYVPEDLPFIRDMNAIAAEYGYPSGCAVANGSTYSGTMVNHVGWGPTPPGDSSAHQENERFPRAAFFHAAGMYAEYLTRALMLAE